MTPQKFLKELKAHNAEQYSIVTALRTIIFALHKNASEEIKYSGLLYSATKAYTGLFVSKNHVSMEFSNGAQMTDPKKLLEGSGKYRRHLKFRTTGDIKEKDVQGFLRQALELDR